MTEMRVRKPDWLRVRMPGGEQIHEIKKDLREKKLFTVCEEAKCPNLGECWTQGTATLMILGEVCTRGCRFCAVSTGNPRGFIDPLEPAKCADTVASMKLAYVVITCVDRDDLPDGGAQHFADVIAAVRERRSETMIEVLTSDYRGVRESVARVVAAKPDVFAHNVETVRRLTPTVRDRRASYDQSLQVLAMVKELEPERLTKSSLMLGLGETHDEVFESLRDLRAVGVDVVTLGQYLQPNKKLLKVQRYLPPEEFDFLAEEARKLGFLYVAAGPLVRSSYKAGEYFLKNHLARERAERLRGVMQV